MRRSLVAILGGVFLVAAAAAPAPAAEARRAMDEGLSLYEARNFAEAARRFDAAAAAALDAGLDPAVARYNQGCALVRAGRGAEAAAALAEALRSPDAGLRGQAHYNRGIALAAEAEGHERLGDLEKAVAALDQALEAYENAMRADPGDEDPKVNHELASRKKELLEERLRERAKERTDPSRPRDPEGGRGEARPKPGPEMTAEEARLMLEATRQQELSRRSGVRTFRGVPAAAGKDW